MSPEPGKFGTEVPVATQPLISSQAAAAAVPTPATIQEARSAGATPGTILAAPLAPATGPIAGDPESLVVVTVKEFWKSPTAAAIKGVLLTAGAAVLLVLGTTILQAWGEGKSLFDAGAIDWRNTERACEIAGGGVIVAAVMAWARKHDNNAVK